MKRITNSTRKEAIEKGLLPWLFSWHDHGWMSVSVRRGLENIKSRGKSTLKLKAIQVYKEKVLSVKPLQEPNYDEAHLVWLFPCPTLATMIGKAP